MKKKRVVIISIILLIVIILAAMFDTRLKIVEYDIQSSCLQGQVRMALVTDLHSCFYGENQHVLIDEIKSYNPHAVLLGGDIFDDVMDNTNSKILVSRLAEEYRTYYVSGNHEWWSEEMYDFFDYLEACGVTVLRGNSDALKINEDIITISGIDDPEVNRYDDTYTGWEEQLKRVGQGLESESFNVLLTHRPELAEQYFMYDFDVVLSGHAHGGQFRIPFVMNGFYAPNQGFFPELAGGEYDFDKGKLIVSRGLSVENFKLPRIFNRPELVFVTADSES